MTDNTTTDYMFCRAVLISLTPLVRATPTIIPRTATQQIPSEPVRKTGSTSANILFPVKIHPFRPTATRYAHALSFTRPDLSRTTHVVPVRRHFQSFTASSYIRARIPRT
jgi:hypothetical protein